MKVEQARGDNPAGAGGGRTTGAATVDASPGRWDASLVQALWQRTQTLVATLKRQHPQLQASLAGVRCLAVCVLAALQLVPHRPLGEGVFLRRLLPTPVHCHGTGAGPSRDQGRGGVPPGVRARVPCVVGHSTWFHAASSPPAATISTVHTWHARYTHPRWSGIPHGRPDQPGETVRALL